MNSLFNTMNPYGNLLGKFSEFRENFRGDPKTMVQNFLNTGKMSQAQFNQIASMATEFQKMIGQ